MPLAPTSSTRLVFVVGCGWDTRALGREKASYEYSVGNFVFDMYVAKGHCAKLSETGLLPR